MVQSKKKLRRQEMFEIVRSCRESGMSISAFIRERGIASNSYYYWNKRYNESEQTNPEGFIPVKINGQENTKSEFIRLVYPNGVKLQMPVNTPVTVIRKLISI